MNGAAGVTHLVIKLNMLGMIKSIFGVWQQGHTYHDVEIIFSIQLGGLVPACPITFYHLHYYSSCSILGLWQDPGPLASDPSGKDLQIYGNGFIVPQ